MLSLTAPAKLNLFLHITGQRPDGYHNLETLFQLLDVGDNLEFSPLDSNDIALSSNVAELASPSNLIVNAVETLKKYVGCKKGIKIHLDKKLPLGAGLGGGSSDAATALIALNHLWKLKLSTDTLAEIGLTLGADVPVFIRGKTAFASGIGEELEPVKLPKKWFLVVTPAIHVSTREIFTHPQLTRNSTAIKIPALLTEGGRNDCQRIVEMIYPEVAETRLWMQRFAPAFLTGTGASLFSIFETEQEARKVSQQVPDKWNCFVASGVNSSPALEAINEQ